MKNAVGKRIRIGLAAALLGLSALAPAAEPLVAFEDPALAARYTRLLHELRCLVCQNQSLADSEAPLAGDLRREVEKLIREGRSDQEIVDYLVARYGDFVLYRPPLKTSTVVLWFAPFILLGVGVTAAVWYVIRRNERKLAARAEQARRERAAALLAEESERQADA